MLQVWHDFLQRSSILFNLHYECFYSNVTTNLWRYDSMKQGQHHQIHPVLCCLMTFRELIYIIVEVKQFTRCGGSAWRRTCQQNSKKGSLHWCFFFHIYPPLTRKRRWRFYFGRILTRSGVDHFPSFPVDVLTSSHVNLLLVRSHQAEIIIVKRLIQGRNNVTRVRVEPRSCDRGRRKNDAFNLLATLPTFLFVRQTTFC